MELRDIEYFGVIAQHGNMRRAAEALGLSPPALSKSLRRLETSLEARLVERTGKGVRLTPMGDALAAQAQRLRLTLEDITREAADLNHGRSGHLRIGAGPTDCELLPAACTRLMKESPKLRIDVTISDNDELVPLILAGNLDLALNTVPPGGYEGIEQVHLLDDEYAAFASASHPFARRRRIPLGELLNRMDELDESRDTIFLCKMGGRSAQAIMALERAGFKGSMRNLRGGITAWSNDVDPKVPKY
jgi:DNA-binding transcriptional LysR family regulator